MKFRNLVLSAAAILFIASVPLAAIAAESGSDKPLSALDIMTKADNIKEPADMISEMTMTLVDQKNNKRVRSVLTARKGKDSTIMWFLSPPDEKGSSFLSIAENGQTNMWIYLPAYKKTSMITSHGKKGVFMGSDFTFEDLEGRKLQNYTYKLLGTEKTGNYDCYKVESVPTAEYTDSGYTKVISWIWKEKFISLKDEYYNKLGVLKKIQTIDSLKEIKGYQLPAKVIMNDIEKNHKTIIDFTNIYVDSGIDTSIFNKRSLTRIFNRDALYKKAEPKEAAK
jgi:hypothetical protein